MTHCGACPGLWWSMRILPAMKPHAKAYLLASSAVLLWSTVATAFKLTLAEVPYAVLLLWSGLTSFLVLSLVVVVRSLRSGLPVVDGRQLGKSALLGLLNPFLYYLVLFRAYDLLPAQQAQPLNYLWPVVLVVFTGILRRHRIAWHVLASLLVCFVGVAVIATRGDVSMFRVSSPSGIGLALGSTVIWALYWVFTADDGIDSVLRLALNFGFGTLYTLVAVLAAGLPLLPSAAGLAGCVYIGLFEMGLTFLLWLSALRHSHTPAHISGIVYFSPFISLIFIAFILGESIHPSTLAGLVLIIGGVVLQQWMAFTAARPRPPRR